MDLGIQGGESFPEQKCGVQGIFTCISVGVIGRKIAVTAPLARKADGNAVLIEVPTAGGFSSAAVLLSMGTAAACSWDAWREFRRFFFPGRLRPIKNRF